MPACPPSPDWPCAVIGTAADLPDRAPAWQLTWEGWRGGVTPVRENARLREDVRRLRFDPGTIEALARKELGLIKPGEVLFIIKNARPAAAAERLSQ